MAIQVACPSCQSTYQLSDGLQGKNVRCKKCGEAFRIGVEDGPSSGPVVFRPGDPPTFIQKGSSTVKSLLIVFGSIAAVSMLVCGGLVSLGYWATKASRERSEEIRAKAAEVIDARSAE